MPANHRRRRSRSRNRAAVSTPEPESVELPQTPLSKGAVDWLRRFITSPNNSQVSTPRASSPPLCTSSGRDSATVLDSTATAKSNDHKPKNMSTRSFSFNCQLAHGSRTVKLTNVAKHKEVYEAIARAFAEDDVKSDDVLFCTVNTYRANMNHLLSSTLAADDMIFAHLRGAKKEVTVVKEAGILGLTITDNFAGRVLIKRLHPQSTCARASPAVAVGDHIERINGTSVVGLRHYQVARLLRAIPRGQPITLRLIAPLTSGLSFISKRSDLRAGRTQQVGSATATIRFRANGEAIVQEETAETPDKQVIERINRIFDEYLGVHDDELALSVWEVGRQSSDLMSMSQQLRAHDELSAFEFPDELVFDMWGLVSDCKKKASNATASRNPQPPVKTAIGTTSPPLDNY